MYRVYSRGLRMCLDQLVEWQNLLSSSETEAAGLGGSGKGYEFSDCKSQCSCSLS